MEERNYYQVLNIDKNASMTEIKSAYLREARTTHPDHNKGKEDEFVKKFQELTESYKTLSDPKLRATYDRNLELKAHLVTKPSIMETFEKLISDKTLSGDSLGKREFATFLSGNGNRSGQYTTDETKRVKLEHVFQFERQGDSFKFHKQPLDSNKSGDFIKNAMMNSGDYSKQKSEDYSKHKLTEDIIKNKSSKIIDVAQNLLSLSQLKSADFSKPSNNSMDYSKVQFPPFSANQSSSGKVDSSQDYKNAPLNTVNSFSNLARTQSNGSQILPPPSNLLTSGSYYNNSVTLQTSLNISFSESVYGCSKNILIKRQTLCPNCTLNSPSSTSTSSSNTLENNNSVSNAENTDNNSKSNLRSVSTPILLNLNTKLEPSAGSQSSFVLSNSPSKEYIKLPLPGKSNSSNEVCKTCNGIGTYSADARVSVTIPAGIINGSRQILKGEGDVSSSGKKGDLIVVVNVEAHPFIRRVGNCDVACDLPLSFAQASLGTALQIPSIYGPVQVFYFSSFIF